MDFFEASELTGKFAVIREYSEWFDAETHKAGSIVFVGNKDRLSDLYRCHFIDGSTQNYVPDELTIIRDENFQWWLQGQFDREAVR